MNLTNLVRLRYQANDVGGMMAMDTKTVVELTSDCIKARMCGSCKHWKEVSALCQRRETFTQRGETCNWWSLL